jgi:PTS system nitrogen regulatory IIA component
MDIADCLDPRRVLLSDGDNKAGVINQLLDIVADTDVGVSRDELERAVWKREELMSTGLGLGLAMPHARLDGIRRMTMAVAVCSSPVADYESFDEEPVRIVVLIASPEGYHEEYLKLLSQTAAVLKEEQRRQAILNADSRQAVYTVFTSSPPNGL